MFVELFLILVVVSSSHAKVLIDSDGGYTNIEVGIHPNIEHFKINNLLQKLENLFTDASKVLNDATKGKVYFKEIIITLPKSYREILKYRNWQASKKNLHTPDIIVTSDDVFQKAYAVQNSGCGKPGLRIHIPDEFVFEQENNKARDLVRAWAKFRFGIFDESGFVGDELYPACYTVPGSNATKVTDCTHRKGVYDFSETISGQSKSCKPIPKRGKNYDVVSSLMNSIDLPNVKLFCDDDINIHNKESPSKQNALCRGQSTWKIISQHSDFHIARSPAITKETTFKYMIESDAKLILAVDTSSKMAANDRIDMVRNAFSHFLLYNLPENSTVGIINLKNIENNPLFVEVETSLEAERLIDTFPETYGEGNICIHCGIEKALQVLKGNSSFSTGQVVIATATDVQESSLNTLEKSLKKNYVTLNVIYFKKKLNEPPLLQKLINITNGRFFYILEEFKPGNTMSSLTQLYEVFRYLHHSFSWINKNHVLVDENTFYASDCATCSMTFNSDESIQNLQVLVTGPDFLVGPPVIKSKIILSNDNQSFYMGDSSFSYKIKIPAYMFNVEYPQTGKWSLSFLRKPGYHKPIVVIIRAFSSKDIVYLKTWTNYNTNENVAILRQPPLELYAELKKQNSPLQGVSIVAKLYHSDSETQVSISLLDAGDGDPDIMKNDGIFSRYLTHAPKAGYYILTIRTDAMTSKQELSKNIQGNKPDYCCGSSYPSTTLLHSNHVSRAVTYGSIFIYNHSIGITLPPRRIVDLRVDKLVVVENSTTCYVLKWTAPGNNHDYGTAKDYQLRVFQQREDAFKKFNNSYVLEITEWNVHGSILTPHPPGMLETAIVELKNLSSGTYYIGICTVSFSGAISEVSNVIEIFYIEHIIASTPHFSTEKDNYFSDDPTGTPANLESSNMSPITAITIATVILAILLIAGIVILCYFKIKTKKENSNENSNTNKTEATNAQCKDKDPENISVISPVNSWPANSLLSHYESLKKPDICNVPIAYKNSEDTVSTSSLAKYPYNTNHYINKSFCDSTYFPNYDRDDINYPFNPIYSSSLQSFHEQRNSSAFSPTTSYYSTLDGRGSHRLRTDV